MSLSPAQKGRLLRRLTRVIENFRDIIVVGRTMGFFLTAFRYLPQLIPVAVVAPFYMQGSVEFGAVTQAAMAFSQVQGAFSLIVTQFQEVTTYAAVIDRLGVLWEATALPSEASRSAQPDDESVSAAYPDRK